MGALPEIIVAPYEVYTAPLGEPFPLLSAVVGGNWNLLGTHGKLNYENDGVQIEHSKTTNLIRSAGSALPVKASRTEENLRVKLKLMDLTLEQYTRMMSQNNPVDTPAASGVQGTRFIYLLMGLVVPEFAMLVRGASPYNDALLMQYECTRVIENGSATVQMGKGTAAMLQFEFNVMADLALPLAQQGGRLIAATAAALP